MIGQKKIALNTLIIIKYLFSRYDLYDNISYGWRGCGPPAAEVSRLYGQSGYNHSHVDQCGLRKTLDVRWTQGKGFL